MEKLNLTFEEKALLGEIRESTNRHHKTVLRAYLRFRHLIPSQAKAATILWLNHQRNYGRQEV